MLPEYDLAQLGRAIVGKFVERLPQGTNLISLEPEVRAGFPSAAIEPGDEQ